MKLAGFMGRRQPCCSVPQISGFHRRLPLPQGSNWLPAWLAVSLSPGWPAHNLRLSMAFDQNQ